jgi:hypothetical protein
MPTRTTIFATNDNVTANDLNALAGAWNSYTPQVDQGVSTNIAKTVTYAKYLQFGKRVEVQGRLELTAAGTSGSPVTVSLPVTAAGAQFYVVGAGSVDDASVSAYGAVVELHSTTRLAFFRTDAPSTSRIGADPAFALASGDIVSFTVVYEAA